MSTTAVAGSSSSEAAASSESREREPLLQRIPDTEDAGEEGHLTDDDYEDDHEDEDEEDVDEPYVDRDEAARGFIRRKPSVWARIKKALRPTWVAPAVLIYMVMVFGLWCVLNSSTTMPTKVLSLNETMENGGFAGWNAWKHVEHIALESHPYNSDRNLQLRQVSCCCIHGVDWIP
jgi:hypothetical protein